MSGAGVPGPRTGEGFLVPARLERPHLADTSVWAKAQRHPVLADWFNAEVRALRIQTCDVVVLELLRSARNNAAFAHQAELLDALDRCPLGTSEVAHARRVQVALAGRGQHRGVPQSDLLIAASAEAAGVPVLHYDHDYDLIAEVTGQPMRWISPAGSLP